MGLAGRRAQKWCARSRALVAIVVLTAWFGTLLVAAPTTPHASATPGSPSLVSGPPAAGNDSTPTWTFTLPADSTSESTTGPDPVTSDTSTVSIAIVHTGKCFVGTAPADGSTVYDACTSTGTPTEFTYTPTALTTVAGYSLYVHDVETTTTTTTTYPADGSPPGAPVVVTDPPAEGTDSAFGPYAFDGTPPALGFDSQPPSPSAVSSPSWTFHTDDATAASVMCTLSSAIRERRRHVRRRSRPRSPRTTPTRCR